MSADLAAAREPLPVAAAERAEAQHKSSEHDTNDDDNVPHLEFLPPPANGVVVGGGGRSSSSNKKPLSQYHPDRMRITQAEYEFAVAIKRAVEESTSEFSRGEFSDFMYVQLAIVGLQNGESMDFIIERCLGMQAFKEEYLVQDSYPQGCRHLDKLVEFYPTKFLMFNYSQEDGCYVFAWDMAKFDPKRLRTHYMYQEWTRARYYCHLVFHPDLESCRRGFIGLIECEGLTLRRDAMKMDKDFFVEFLQYYPFFGQAKQFNAGVFAITVWSILKKFLPDKIKDAIQPQTDWQGGHLGDHMLTPTVQDANTRMLTSMKSALKRRLEMEEKFRLSDYHHAYEAITAAAAAAAAAAAEGIQE